MAVEDIHELDFARETAFLQKVQDNAWKQKDHEVKSSWTGSRKSKYTKGFINSWRKKSYIWYDMPNSGEYIWYSIIEKKKHLKRSHVC